MLARRTRGVLAHFWAAVPHAARPIAFRTSACASLGIVPMVASVALLPRQRQEAMGITIRHEWPQTDTHVSTVGKRFCQVG